MLSQIGARLPSPSWFIVHISIQSSPPPTPPRDFFPPVLEFEPRTLCTRRKHPLMSPRFSLIFPDRADFTSPFVGTLRHISQFPLQQLVFDISLFIRSLPYLLLVFLTGMSAFQGGGFYVVNSSELREGLEHSRYSINVYWPTRPELFTLLNNISNTHV